MNWRPCRKKRRRWKAWERAHVHYATHQARTRELGDHRRWQWMAASPWTERGYAVRFDPHWGRLWSFRVVEAPR